MKTEVSTSSLQGQPVRSLGTPCIALPRFIRLRDAPSYLGMDKNRFNRDVRPQLSSIPIGTQGIAFDRLDLDGWADDYKSRNGHPAAQPKRKKPWETKERRASKNVVAYGTSTSSSEEHAFARALEQARSGWLKSSKKTPSSTRGVDTQPASSATAATMHGTRITLP